MKAGVVDFLEKPFDDEIFLRAVRAALHSGVRSSQEDADRRRFQSMLATLSPRETEVLHGVVDGHSNKEIARQLGISPRTVEVYRAHVMSKTGSQSLSELVRIALLAGF
jgi:two-component system response regulator FixJ